MLVNPPHPGYATVWACPAPVPSWDMWGRDGQLWAVPVGMHAGETMPGHGQAQHAWEATCRQDALPFAAMSTWQVDGHDSARSMPRDSQRSAELLAARVEQDDCGGAIDVEQQSVAISSCSTASSIVEEKKRRRRPRAPPVQRNAEAARRREAERLEQLLQSRDALSAQLKAGGENASRALAQLNGFVWRLSLDSIGCRIVQDAIDAATGTARTNIVNELRNHVREGMGSRHANYVLQKVVEVMPFELACFVAEELAGITADTCRHRYGCRIISRLIEQFARSKCVTKLLEEMMKELALFIRHSFGHHVVQAVLEHADEKYKRTIAKELAADILTIATNRNGTLVIERALLHCESAEVAMLMKLLTNDEVLDSLLVNQFGIYVVKTLLETAPAPMADRILEKVNSAPEDVRDDKHFQKLLELLQEDAKKCVEEADS